MDSLTFPNHFEIKGSNHSTLILLKEVKKVLKKGGCIIVTGEQIVTKFLYIKRIIKTFCKDILFLFGIRKWEKQRKVSKRSLFSYKFRELFPSDSKKGDTHYTLKMVKELFESMNLNFESFKLKNGNKNNRIYIARKQN